MEFLERVSGNEQYLSQELQAELELGIERRLPQQGEKQGAFQAVVVVKNPPDSAEDVRDTGSIPAQGRSPGEGHGNQLQYSCLENPVNRGAWWATGSQGHKELDTTEATKHVPMHVW